MERGAASLLSRRSARVLWLSRTRRSGSFELIASCLMCSHALTYVCLKAHSQCGGVLCSGGHVRSVTNQSTETTGEAYQETPHHTYNSCPLLTTNPFRNLAFDCSCTFAGRRCILPHRFCPSVGFQCKEATGSVLEMARGQGSAEERVPALLGGARCRTGCWRGLQRAGGYGWGGGGVR